MKNTRFYVRASTLFAVLALVSMQACKKDSDPSPTGKNGVEGNWQMSAITVTPAQNGITNLLDLVVALSGNDCLKKITFTFKGDGTLAGSAPKECQGTIDDTADDIGVSEKSTWKVEGSKLIMTTGSDREEYELKVDKSTMEWSTNEVNDDDGKPYTTTLVFKRV